jgi:hypothetical protein
MKQALAQSADEMQGMMKRLAPVGPVSGHNKARGLQPGALRRFDLADMGWRQGTVFVRRGEAAALMAIRT